MLGTCVVFAMVVDRGQPLRGVAAELIAGLGRSLVGRLAATWLEVCLEGHLTDRLHDVEARA